MKAHLSYCTLNELEKIDANETSKRAAECEQADPDFAKWSRGYGVIQHDDLTKVRVHNMIGEMAKSSVLPDVATGYRRLEAADRIASAGMWLVVHMTYANRVRLNGDTLGKSDFKTNPEGHTGGSLNMVPAYGAYLLLNALDGNTRSWMMGQGHCVAAIDALNVIVGNTLPRHSERYPWSDPGISRFVSDFYSYAQSADGSPASPLGSHVNAHTAGGTQEGGYLGFTELQYVHAPLPGERLVAFLSDGAFEEQRGSDWAPRWWRQQDSGLVAPIMILNGRRIEQRTQIEQLGGEKWFHKHLLLNGFQPIGLDGRDPASIAWGIYTMENKLLESVPSSEGTNCAPRNQLHYGVAETIKGFGFPGAGTNRAHNLPLPGNPSADAQSRELFRHGAKRLYVPPVTLKNAVAELETHAIQKRPREKDHALASRFVNLPKIPNEEVHKINEMTSPMAALDRQFCTIVKANPALRPRLSNPDELRSNRFDQTLDLLKHRVFEAEPGVAESPLGCVITALNEEATVCAAFGNKGGINMVVTYEAFAPKMLGAIRQEVTFARQLAISGRPAGWLSIPIVLTSHTWENSKNEISHQDTTLSEALLGEMSDTISVLFPPDANAAVAALSQIYRNRGRIAVLIVPKKPVRNYIAPFVAADLCAKGAAVFEGDPHEADIILSATGAYQLQACLKAKKRLEQRQVSSALVYIFEPGRLRTPRDKYEAAFVADDKFLASIFPANKPRLFVTHMRPEPFLGTLRRIDTGPKTTKAIGFINRGGTLDLNGMMFANRTSWAHIVAETAAMLSIPLENLLDTEEIEAISGQGQPNILWV